MPGDEDDRMIIGQQTSNQNINELNDAENSPGDCGRKRIRSVRDFNLCQQNHKNYNVGSQQKDIIKIK
ncbi:21_t:CDS:1, partial [Entrophospora sp. SA101]